MAPEIIRGKFFGHFFTGYFFLTRIGLSYGLEVDMWAVGVIAFVMMGGYVPFDGENDSEVFASILGLKFYFQSPEWDHVGQDGRDFIRSLLKLNPSERLTARQALGHSFITKFAPESMRTIPPLPSDQSNSTPATEEPKMTSTSVHGSSNRGRTESGSKTNKVKQTQQTPEKLDLSKNPRQTVLDRISTLCKSLGKDDPRSGELKYMKAIVTATGTGTSKLEVAILEETWERLNIVQTPSTGTAVTKQISGSTKKK
jgi:serine/threonine protein kinase